METDSLNKGFSLPGIQLQGNIRTKFKIQGSFTLKILDQSDNLSYVLFYTVLHSRNFDFQVRKSTNLASANGLICAYSVVPCIIHPE